MSARPKRSFLSRRTFIIGGGLVACCAIGSTASFAGIAIFGNDPQSNEGELDFKNPLAIPPLAEPEIDAEGRKTWNLTIQTGETEILPGKTATTWGIEGPYLAPTLRAARGEDVSITLHNELPEETTIHWHGMHLPAKMDGGPHQTIPVGESWNPYWKIEQPAATLWYHPHPHGKTAEHVYRGVTGFFLIDDEPGDALDLPREYGIDDVPLLIQDKKFTDDGDFDLSAGSFLDNFTGAPAFGIRGDKILVNGTYDPVFEVTRQRIRFRILNGSNARFYNLGFSDDRPFKLIASDNGFMPGEPPELTRLLLGPAERAEIVVEFSEGDEVILHSFKQEAVGTGVQGRQIGAEDTFDIVKFRAAAMLESSPELPAQLVEIGDARDIPDDVTVRSFTLDGHGSINGEKMDMNRIDVVVPANAREIWEVESSGQPHTFHIHGSTFHVLEANGEEPPPELRGPKDTVFVSSDHPVRLLVQFRGHIDPDMPYMYHCHILKHEDNGMMGQFVVVEPGMEAVTSRTVEGAHAHH
jgi:FtsP/CotA-like multicopper oxidase with cupredoxin domain